MSDDQDWSNLQDYTDDPIEGEAEAAETENQKVDEDRHIDVHAAGFKEFLLKPELLRAIGDCGFEHPSTVQNECIPQAILGTDVLCQAKSGMGKTAVFVLSTLHQLDPVDGEVHVIVLCHTRELAFQISNEYERFKKYLPNVKTGVFYGGVPVQKDRDLLKNNPPQVVIGTPGRVLQLVNEKSLKLDKIKYFILDECDQLLESLDMRRDVQSIFKHTPFDKQVMMFSATLSDTIKPVCKKFMKQPHEIIINDGAKLTLHGLHQFYVELGEKEKNRKLVDILDSLEFNQCVIFVKSVNRAHQLNKLLVDCSFPSICIHSQLKQPERIARYKKFKEGASRIMVATNIFGRGIDIERINVVINYDMAESADTYLHRVGRAGRFGTKGLAISFITAAEDSTTLQAVQDRFAVDVPKLPDEIDSATYM